MIKCVVTYADGKTFQVQLNNEVTDTDFPYKWQNSKTSEFLNASADSVGLAIESLKLAYPGCIFKLTKTIYAYDTPTYREKGWIKVGETIRDELVRVSEQVTASNPETITIRKRWDIPFENSDHDVHNILENKLGKRRIYKRSENVIVEKEDDGRILFQGPPRPTEWFVADIDDIDSAINILLRGIGRPDSFPLREEQSEFVDKAYNYFTKGGKDFLGNAKCRFGKTFATYCLMKKLGAKITLILTYKPAVGGEWKENLDRHTSFVQYKFYHALDFDKNNPIKIDSKNVVLFASFQDILGEELDGTPKAKWKHVLAFLKGLGIDLLVIDEEHFGSRTKSAKAVIESLEPYRFKLNLSGTPLDSLMSGDYTDENTYTWSYIDEQKKKRREACGEWKSLYGEKDVYKWLPEEKIYTYELGYDVYRDSDAYTAEEGLRLNKFFASENGETFNNSAAVERWLNLMAVEDARFWCSPFNNDSLAGKLLHTFWILSDVNACKAMRRVLEKHPFFRLFRIVTASDDNDGEGRDTLKLVKDAIKDNPNGTITLSCGKLNTGVTIKPWTAVFQLSDSASPETYWQTNFRPQSEYKEMGKSECFVFDFNPNRTLTMIYLYCEITARKNQSTPAAIREFLETIKVLSYSGNKLVPMTADELEKKIRSTVDIALESKKFASARMVSVNNVDEAVKNSLLGVMRVGGETTNTEIAKSGLENGKTFINHGGKRKGKKTDPEIELIEKGITIVKSLPTFVFASDESKKYESLTDILNTNEAESFKEATTISLDEFRHMINCGFFVGERLDRSIQALHLIQNEV
jgi:hypothetical protein